MNEHGFYALMACSSRMKPQQLLKWMAKDLPIRSWRVVYHHKLRSVLLTRRIKKTKCQYLLTNDASLKVNKLLYHRARSPNRSNLIWSPSIQKEYNKKSG